MAQLSEIPALLTSTPFTAEQAKLAGVSRSRLRRSDILTPVRGLYVVNAHQLSLEALAVGVTNRFPGSTITGLSAAQLYRFPLEPWNSLPKVVANETAGTTESLRFDPDMDCFELIPDGYGIKSKSRMLNFRYHRVAAGHRTTMRMPQGEVVPIVSRQLAWLVTASRVSFEVAVAIADHLLRYPRFNFENRVDPYASLQDLRELLDIYAGCKGVSEARAALEYAAVGADSLPETRLRLGLQAAGFKQIELNPLINIEAGERGNFSFQRQPDLYLPEAKALVEYDGSTHLQLESAIRDRDKDQATRAAGFKVVRIYKSDLPPMDPRIWRKSEVLRNLRNSRAVELLQAELSSPMGNRAE